MFHADVQCTVCNPGINSAVPSIAVPDDFKSFLTFVRYHMAYAYYIILVDNAVARF